MQGGTVVQDEEEAVAYVKLLKRDVSPGDRLVEEPCVPEWYRQRIEADTYGEQLCPRAELDHENVVAGSLAATYIQSPNNVLFNVLWELDTEGESAVYKHQLALRISNAVNDPRIIALVEQKREAARQRK